MSKQYPEGHPLHGLSQGRLSELASMGRERLGLFSALPPASNAELELLALVHEHDRLKELADGDWKTRAEKAECFLSEMLDATKKYSGGITSRNWGQLEDNIKTACNERDEWLTLAQKAGAEAGGFGHMWSDENGLVSRVRKLRERAEKAEAQRELDRAAIRKKDEHIAKLEAERDAKPAPSGMSISGSPAWIAARAKEAGEHIHSHSQGSASVTMDFTSAMAMVKHIDNLESTVSRSAGELNSMLSAMGASDG